MDHNAFEKEIQGLIDSFSGVAAVAAEDLDTKEAFAWNEDRIITPASTIKLPVLCAAYYWAERGEVDLDSRIPIKAADRVGGNGVLYELAEGLAPTLRDLMTLMIVISDNMATNLVMEAVGTDRIKVFLEASGLGEIRAERKMLDPAGMKAGLVNCVTAGGLGRLLRGLAEETLLSPEHCREALDILLRQQCNNKMPVKVIDRWDLVFKKNEIKIAHKTGDMPGIEHDIGIVFTPRSKFVLVLLTEEGDNEAAIELVQELARRFVDYYDGTKEAINDSTAGEVLV